MALQLLSHSFGPILLAAAPPGSMSSTVAFKISCGGPFTILGFYINPIVSSAEPRGLVQIGLHRINGEGIIHPSFEIARDHGVRPQDLVIRYGSVLSATSSLSFFATQGPAASGTGAEVKLHGALTYLADSSGTMTVEVTPP